MESMSLSAQHHTTIKFAVGIKENREKHPVLYWLPKLLKITYYTASLFECFGL